MRVVCVIIVVVVADGPVDETFYAGRRCRYTGRPRQSSFFFHLRTKRPFWCKLGCKMGIYFENFAAKQNTKKHTPQNCLRFMFAVPIKTQFA